MFGSFTFKAFLALLIENYRDFRLAHSPEFPFRLEVIHRVPFCVLNPSYKDQKQKHAPPPGFSNSKSKYDLILNPVGLHYWATVFMLVGALSYIPAFIVSSKIHPVFFSLLPILLYVIGYFFLRCFLYSYHYYNPLFYQAWDDLGDSFNEWFRKIPQRVLLQNDDESLAWWLNPTSKKPFWKSDLSFKPKFKRMPLYISSQGSAQESILLASMEKHFSNIGKSSTFFGRLRIYVYWLAPMWFSILLQFLIIIIILLYLAINTDKGYPSVFLIVPAFTIMVCSGLFLHWSWKFIEARQDEEYNYQKYTPPTIQHYIDYDPVFFSYFKEAHVTKTTVIVSTIIFSGLILLISILNEYNPQTSPVDLCPDTTKEKICSHQE